MAALDLNDADYIVSTSSPAVASDNIVLVVSDGGVAPFTLPAGSTLTITKTVSAEDFVLAEGTVPAGTVWTVTIQAVIKQVPPAAPE